MVEENARLEFHCLWKEMKRTGKQSHILTDLVSNKINSVNTDVQGSINPNPNPNTNTNTSTNPNTNTNTSTNHNPKTTPSLRMYKAT